VTFNPAADPDVAQALAQAVAAGVPRSEIDQALQDATLEPDDEMAPIVVAGRLYGLIRAQRIRAGKTHASSG
jgi:hypothetical protein